MNKSSIDSIQKYFPPTPTVGRKEYRQLIRQLHKALRDTEGGGSLIDRFEEITKILFCKMYDESKGMDSVFNDFHAADDVLLTKKLQDLYQEAFNPIKGNFDLRYQQLNIGSHALSKLVKLVQPFELSKIREDVKGTAYEEIVKNTFEKGDNQQFFTPRNVVDFMIRMVEPQADKLVCDPACGSGGFLVASMEYLKNKANNTNERLKIYGFEIDPRMAWVSKMNLMMHGDVNADIRYLNHGGSLSKKSNPLTDVAGKIDYIITNPPFGSDFNKTEDLQNFVLGYNRPSRRRGILFIERALELLKPGGKLGIIIDEGVLNSPSTADVREYIRKQTVIEAIISLPEVTFMPYASVKSSILFLRKKTTVNEAQSDIFMGACENVGHRPNGDPIYLDACDSNGQPLINNELPLILLSWKKFQNAPKSKQALGENCYVLRSDDFLQTKLDERLDFFYHHPDRRKAELLLKNCPHPLVPLAEIIIERNEVINLSIEQPDENCRFIGLANIKSMTGEHDFSFVLGAKLKSHVKKYYPGDILFSKMRPELRKITLIDNGEDEGYTSSECDIFRCLNDEEGTGKDLFETKAKVYKVNAQYLAFILRSNIVYGQIVYQVTGVGRPRINKSALMKVKIPLPSLAVQLQIVRRIKEADKKRQEYLKKSEDAVAEAKTITQELLNIDFQTD